MSTVSLSSLGRDSFHHKWAIYLVQEPSRSFYLLNSRSLYLLLCFLHSLSFTFICFQINLLSVYVFFLLSFILLSCIHVLFFSFILYKFSFFAFIWQSILCGSQGEALSGRDFINLLHKKLSHGHAAALTSPTQENVEIM